MGKEHLLETVFYVSIIGVLIINASINRDLKKLNKKYLEEETNRKFKKELQRKKKLISFWILKENNLPYELNKNIIKSIYEKKKFTVWGIVDMSSLF